MGYRIKQRPNVTGFRLKTIMELYFKDLISNDASLEKLVDDLSLVVHGADDFAKAVGVTLSEESRREVTSRLDRLKDRCRKLKGEAIAQARAADKVLRDYPYSFAGIAFVVGLVVGTRFGPRE